jgi:guanidinopropionase
MPGDPCRQRRLLQPKPALSALSASDDLFAAVAALSIVRDLASAVHIGIRDPYVELEPFAVESGMKVIDVNQFHDLGIAKVIERTRAIVGDGPTYITFDIDGLDPAFAPRTGTPVVGGLTSYEAKRLLQGLRGLDIIGGDVVEISPPFDSAGITALAGAQVLFEILCLAAEAFARRRSAR